MNSPNSQLRLGPMSVEHKSRNDTRRKRVVRDPNQMRKPQELREDDIARQENETTKNVVQISNILDQCEQDRVNLFELVINPESFGQTIENIFYLSFLVRDGKVSIAEVDVNNPDDSLHEDDRTGLRDNANIQPMVELTEVPTAEDYQAGLLKKQMVMELDMAMWRVSWAPVLCPLYQVCASHHNSFVINNFASACDVFRNSLKCTRSENQ